MKFEARIDVAHLPGILDPAGATIERALPALGYSNVESVRVGKSIRLVIEAASEDAALAQIDDLCRRLLANPVIEHYDVHLTEMASG